MWGTLLLEFRSQRQHKNTRRGVQSVPAAVLALLRTREHGVNPAVRAHSRQLPRRRGHAGLQRRVLWRGRRPRGVVALRDAVHLGAPERLLPVALLVALGHLERPLLRLLRHHRVLEVGHAGTLSQSAANRPAKVFKAWGDFQRTILASSLRAQRAGLVATQTIS